MWVYTPENNRFLHSPRTARRWSMRNEYALLEKSVTPELGLLLEAENRIKNPLKVEKKELDPDLLDFEMLSAVFEKDLVRFEKYLNLGANPSASYKGWSALMLRLNLISAEWS